MPVNTGREGKGNALPHVSSEDLSSPSEYTFIYNSLTGYLIGSAAHLR